MDDKYYTEGNWYCIGNVIKRRHTYFFSSSHERGLTELLEMWPQVREAIPDAVLHVGYGTYTASQMAKMRKDQQGLDAIRSIEQELHNTDGIVYHGRLNQWELAKVQLTCEMWLYPYQHDPKWNGTPGFPETYGITAVEAQAARAIPFTRLNAGLLETVKNSIEWTKEMTTSDVIKRLKNPSKYFTKDQLEDNYNWAMKQTWAALAKEWLMRFILSPQPTKKELELTGVK